MTLFFNDQLIMQNISKEISENYFILKTDEIIYKKLKQTGCLPVTKITSVGSYRLLQDAKTSAEVLLRNYAF